MIVQNNYTLKEAIINNNLFESTTYKRTSFLYEQYGNFVQVPYSWYRLCRKYIIPYEVADLKNKDNSLTLNVAEINVLAYLANYDECYVSNGMIANIFDVKKHTIEKYIRELRWVGFIKTYESKESPIYTLRRNIYVQHDVIKAVLENDDDPYICNNYDLNNTEELKLC